MMRGRQLNRMWAGSLAAIVGWEILPRLALSAPAAPPAAARGPVADAVAGTHVPLAHGAVTFDRDIAPIVFGNCSSCHRPGEVAPFSLLSYQDVRKRAQQIAEVTGQRVMPPWKADEGSEKFHDARRLSEAQIATIKQWAAAGAPEGSAADLPPEPHFTSDWHLGPPDAIFSPSEDYTVAADGSDIYRCFVIPTDYNEDRWVTAMEVRPGNRAVVHHVLVYLDTGGRARQKDAADPGPGYTSGGGIGFMPSGYLGGWAPGNLPRRLPEGVGIRLPKGVDIVLQVHYHRTGKEETDRSKIALYFSQVPVDKQMNVLPLVPLGLHIPAGDKSYQIEAAFPVLMDATLLRVSPHMHLLGHDMTVTAKLPDGTQKKLVCVPEWDFNWQTTYSLKDPIKLPAGSTVSLVAHYDNSADNPRNPNNPPLPIRWGEKTSDEMCIAFLDFTVDAQHLAPK